MKCYDHPRRAAFAAALLLAVCAILIAAPASEGASASGVTAAEDGATLTEPGTYAVQSGYEVTADLSAGSFTIYMMNGSAVNVLSDADSDGGVLTLWLATSVSGSGSSCSVEYIADSDMALAGGSDGAFVVASMTTDSESLYLGVGTLFTTDASNRAAYATDGTSWAFLPVSYHGSFSLSYGGFNHLTFKKDVAYTMQVDIGGYASVALDSANLDGELYVSSDSAVVESIGWTGKLTVLSGIATYEGYHTFSADTFSGGLVQTDDFKYIGVGDMGSYTAPKNGVCGVYDATGVSFRLSFLTEYISFRDISSAGDSDALVAAVSYMCFQISGACTGTIESNMSSNTYEGTLENLHVVDEGFLAIESGKTLTITGSVTSDKGVYFAHDGILTLQTAQATTIDLWISYGYRLALDSVVAPSLTITDCYRTAQLSGYFLSGTISAEDLEGISVVGGSLMGDIIAPETALSIVAGDTDATTYLYGTVTCASFTAESEGTQAGTIFGGEGLTVLGDMTLRSDNPVVVSQYTTAYVSGNLVLESTVATLLGEFTVAGTIVADDTSKILCRYAEPDNIHASNLDEVVVMQCAVSASEWWYVEFTHQLGVVYFELYGEICVDSDFTLCEGDTMITVTADLTIAEGVTFTNYGTLGTVEMGDAYYVTIEDGASLVNHGTLSVYGSVLTVEEGGSLVNDGMMYADNAVIVQGSFANNDRLYLDGATLTIGGSADVKARSHGDIHMNAAGITVASGSILFNYGTIDDDSGASVIDGAGELRNMRTGVVNGVDVETGTYSDGANTAYESAVIAAAIVVAIVALIVAAALARRP